MSRAAGALALATALAATGCMSLDVDLESVPVPVSAQRADTDADPIVIEEKHVMYAHGLLGESEPDVGALVADASAGYRSVSGFRVTHGAGFHDWLLTHLSLTLVRVKTVRIEMQRVR